MKRTSNVPTGDHLFSNAHRPVFEAADAPQMKGKRPQDRDAQHKAKG